VIKREQAILAQIMEGNLPDFLRNLKPVRLIDRLEDGKSTTATIFVTPDYSAIGSDDDFLLMPMSLYTATGRTERLGPWQMVWHSRKKRR